MTAGTSESAVSPAPSAPPVTCDTPCGSVLLDGIGYASTWKLAVDSGWGTDAAGLRRCRACMAARIPSAGMYVPDGDLAAWIASLDPDPVDPLGTGEHAGGAIRVPPYMDPDFLVLPLQAIPASPAPPPVPSVPAPGITAAQDREDDKAEQRSRDDLARWSGLPLPAPGSPEALAAYREVSNSIHYEMADDDPAGPDGTAVQPAVSAETETFPVIEGDQK
jgi:hypothetical protein